jgi:hypothetical protein
MVQEVIQITVKPLPPPSVPGNTEAARMDNAVRMLFKASKAEYVKPERESKKKRAKKPH